MKTSGGPSRLRTTCARGITIIVRLCASSLQTRTTTKLLATALSSVALSIVTDLLTLLFVWRILSSVYAVGDPRRFHMGTPAQVWSTMTRCWQVEPTSDRIVEDILALLQVLERIIAARGCVVQDQFLRSRAVQMIKVTARISRLADIYSSI